MTTPGAPEWPQFGFITIQPPPRVDIRETVRQALEIIRDRERLVVLCRAEDEATVAEQLVIEGFPMLRITVSPAVPDGSVIFFVRPEPQEPPVVGAMIDIEPEFVCPVCEKKSWHPDDRRNGYCGRCHAYTASPVPDTPTE